MLENLPAMVCLVTTEYHVAFANRLLREKYGELTGKPCYMHFEGKEQPCEFCEAFQVLKTGKPHHWVVNTQDGSIIDAYDYPFTDADGSSMVLEVNIDITERKNLEKQLQEKERLAAIGATAGMVGHDIRNPLQAITSDVYLLKDYLATMPELPTKKDVAESLDGIEKNVDYINKIVMDLQDYAKPINPSFQEIALAKLFDEVTLKKSIPEKIQASYKIEKDVEYVVSDRDLLKRVLFNLINNAVEAMPDGGDLTVHAFKQDNDLVIEVKDTGVGIPDAVKPKLFTPMVTTKSKGQGFGLAVIKRITEGLGGTVSFESQEGKGTTFIVRLPPKELNGK